MGYRADGRLEWFGRAEAMLAAQRRTVERVGELLDERVREHTPVATPPPGHEAEWLISRHGRLPGALRDSWQVGEVTVNMAGTVMSIEVFTRDEVAPYVEWPTLPHIIVPRNPGGLLRFWDAFGHTIYARIVHHTGTKGSYMMTTASAEIAVEWQAIGAEELERWARDQAAGVHHAA